MSKRNPKSGKQNSGKQSSRGSPKMKYGDRKKKLNKGDCRYFNMGSVLIFMESALTARSTCTKPATVASLSAARIGGISCDTNKRA